MQKEFQLCMYRGQCINETYFARRSASKAFRKLDIIRRGSKLETKVTANRATKIAYFVLSTASSYNLKYLITFQSTVHLMGIHNVHDLDDTLNSSIQEQ